MQYLFGTAMQGDGSGELQEIIRLTKWLMEARLAAKAHTYPEIGSKFLLRAVFSTTTDLV